MLGGTVSTPMTLAGRAGRRRRRWAATVVILTLLALLAAGCGSRANKAQVAEALRVGGPGGGGGTGGGTTAGGSGAGTTGASSNAAPAGGNGGATDVGVTATSITMANVSILTGPVPGLFAGAVNGTDAFFAYQNSQGGVFGRQLKLKVGDDQFDCSRNKAVTQSYITQVFAFVGSFSLYDDCGAQVFAQNTGVPDVHAALARGAQKEVNNFSPQPIRQGASLGPFQWAKSKYPDAITKSASLIGDVQSARDAWEGQSKAMESIGYKFIYTRLYEPTETDFTSDIVKMRANKVQNLVLIAADVKGIARIESAAKQQNWRPQLTLLGASAYDPTLIPLAGADAVEGAFLFLPSAMYLGEDSGNKEVGLFNTWLKKTHPNANADLFTVFGWSSARLFVQALQAAGPKATRAGVMAELRKVNKFDSNTLLASAGPASKTPPVCFVIIQVKGGKFARVDPAGDGYDCNSSYFMLPGG